MKFEEIVRSVMRETGLSQQSLGRRLGLSQKIVSDWLHGKSMPNYHSLMAIYRAFGITPNEIVGIETYRGVRRENALMPKHLQPLPQ